jgi:hypothetical protein
MKKKKQIKKLISEYESMVLSINEKIKQDSLEAALTSDLILMSIVREMRSTVVTYTQFISSLKDIISEK